MKAKQTLLLFVVLTNLFFVNLSAQKKFELADVAKFTSVSDPQLSPDGKSIVIVVSKPDYIQNRYNAELVLVDIASGKRRSLTQ